MEKENPETQQMEEVPSFLVELHNRLSPEMDTELQFELGQIDYNAMFLREWGFGTMEEATVARDILLEIKRLDDLDTPYTIIHSDFTNTMALTPVAQGNPSTQYYTFPSSPSHDSTMEILMWINMQEKHLTM